jgi:hypothetical protein
MSHTTDGDAARQGQGDVPHKAGAFDIRVFIASLIGIYGVVLLIAGLVQSDDQLVKTDGVNMNLFAGIGMIIFSAAFLIWARLRPVVVRAVPPDPDGRPPSAH